MFGGGMTGWNVNHPYTWFATAGDQSGDISHNSAYSPDGNFFNDQTQVSGAANPAGAASLYPSASGAAMPVGAYAGYVNQALQHPGSQFPLQGGPDLLLGPQQGPWAYSDYAMALPTQYLSPAPPWKNGPMQTASNDLPASAQMAIHATALNPPVQQGGALGGCGGSGCGGGCGQGNSSFCRGRTHQALSLDSTNDFPPLYSHYQANPNQVVNARLYHAVSTHVPAWAVAQGAPSDFEQPLQGH